MSRPLTPSDVLDAQMDLVHRLEVPRFRELLRENFMADWYNMEPGAYKDNNADQMVAGFRNAVPNAHLYRVTEDMVDLLLHSAAALDDEDVFDRHLAPTGIGMVHFAKGVPVHDLRGQVMLAHWLVWHPVMVQRIDKHGAVRDTATSISLTWFNDTEVQPDEVAYRMRSELAKDWGVDEREAEQRVQHLTGRWRWVGTDTCFDNAAIGEVLSAVPQNILDYEPELRDGDKLATSTTNLTRVCHALWLMLNQTITRVEDEPVQRASMRRAKRMNLPGRVTVVRLRRYENHRPNEGEAYVEWQHRFWRRAHWRWQPYGPGLTERRRIWINPMLINGDREDLPMLHAEKLYSLEK